MNDYEWDYTDEDLEEFNRRRIPRIFKFLSLILLISFLALCFPWLNHFLNDSFELIQQNQELFSKDIVVNAKPAIVSIQAVDSSTAKKSRGTGFIISPQGVIVTNAHVVEDAKSVRITLDNEEIMFSNLIEIIPDNDLAIIRIDKDNLPYLQIEEEQVSIDDIVTIIGNPLWYYKIAQQGRVEAFTYIADNENPVIYIDIAINPGNSGSPVLNEAGKV
ncbi:MAG: trypsin-like peptidase domain-containing protein, partial [Syntrophomonadaceae bacterium]|nr:trypsin-like peptidase domain-containing protein [Syntrophomonadaceae bacterium]